MNDLFILVEEFSKKLINRQDELLSAERVNYLRKKALIQSKTDMALFSFSHNSLDTLNTIKKFRYGNLINLDLLADFLKSIVYMNLPHGSYEELKQEKSRVRFYQNEKNKKVYAAFYKVIFIYTFMNDFLTFVYQNYNENFLKENSKLSIDDQNLFYQIPFLCRNLFDVGNYIYNRNLKTASDAISFIKDSELKKEDLLSSYIDTNEYQNGIINVYRTILDELIKLSHYAKENKPKAEVSLVKKEIMLEFIEELKKYVRERITTLQNINKKYSKEK